MAEPESKKHTGPAECRQFLPSLTIKNREDALTGLL